METLVFLLALVFWSCASYFIAKKVKEKHPSFNIEPMMYATGSLLIGFVWVMLFLGVKFIAWNSKQNK